MTPLDIYLAASERLGRPATHDPDGALFVNEVAGAQMTHPAASLFLAWGRPVAVAEAEGGDVAVFHDAGYRVAVLASPVVTGYPPQVFGVHDGAIRLHREPWSDLLTVRRAGAPAAPAATEDPAEPSGLVGMLMGWIASLFGRLPK